MNRALSQEEQENVCICRTPQILYGQGKDGADHCGRCGQTWNARVYRSMSARVEPTRRNEACPCGSGLKHKRCCWPKGIYR